MDSLKNGKLIIEHCGKTPIIRGKTCICTICGVNIHESVIERVLNNPSKIEMEWQTKREKLLNEISDENDRKTTEERKTRSIINVKCGCGINQLYENAIGKTCVDCEEIYTVV